MIKITSKWLIFLSLVSVIGCGSNNQSDITPKSDDQTADELLPGSAIVLLSPEHLSYSIHNYRLLPSAQTSQANYLQPVDRLLEKYYPKDDYSVDISINCNKPQCDDAELLKQFIIYINTLEDTFILQRDFEELKYNMTSRIEYTTFTKYNSPLVSEPSVCVPQDSSCVNLYIESVSCDDYLENGERYAYVSGEVFLGFDSNIGYFADCSVGRKYLVVLFSFYIRNLVVPSPGFSCCILKGELVIANVPVICSTRWCFADIVN